MTNFLHRLFITMGVWSVATPILAANPYNQQAGDVSYEGFYSVVIEPGTLPPLKRFEPYVRVRQKMLAGHWKPYHAKDADKYSRGDKLCNGRPEMVHCSADGHCKYLWLRPADRIANHFGVLPLVGICTDEETDGFVGICLPE
jgi:hypothetical protein